MTSKSGSRGFTRASVVMAIAVFALMLIVVVAALSGSFSLLHSVSFRGGVDVMQAEMLSADRFRVNVNSCNADPEVTLLRESDLEVQIKVVSSKWPFRGGGDDCGDVIEVQLEEPLRDRVLIDKHSDREVDVSGGVSVRGQADLYIAELVTPDRLSFDLHTCNGNPELATLRETAIDVRVGVTASSNPYPATGNDCKDNIEVQLQEPLGDRTVIDLYDNEQLRFWIDGYIFRAIPLSENRLRLDTDICQGRATVNDWQESDVDVQVKVIGLSEFYGTEQGCFDSVVVELREPLGDRVVVDINTGQSVSIQTIESVLKERNQPPSLDEVLAGLGDPPNEAELQDLARIATQQGITLAEAIERYASSNDVSVAINSIREGFPDEFAGAAIIDGDHVWIAFADEAPDAALVIIDLFSTASGITFEIRTDFGFTEAEISDAVPAAHYAVYESPDVRDAVTSYNYDTGQITTTFAWEETASESTTDVLRIAAMNAIQAATGPDFLKVVEYVLIHSDEDFGIVLE